jgi:hypothetical protein
LICYLDGANQKSYVNGSTVWNDLSKNQYTASLVNGPAADSSNLGNVFFDGINDKAILGAEILNPYNIAGQKITVNIWMKTPFTPGYGIIMNFGQKYEIEINNSGQSIGYNTVAGDLYGIDSGLSVNTWFNLTCIVTQGNVSGNKMYLNGVNQTLSYFLGTSSNNSNAIFGTGMMIADWFDSPGTLPLTMNLASLQIYNRELTVQEILQNYNSLKSRFGL